VNLASEGRRDQTHETISGCSANGRASFENIRKERTRTGDENLRAARFDGPAGSRVDQWSNMPSRDTGSSLILYSPDHERSQPSQHQAPHRFTTPPQTSSQQQLSQSRTRGQLQRSSTRPSCVRQHQCRVGQPQGCVCFSRVLAFFTSI
jgi:hypothetical protein